MAVSDTPSYIMLAFPNGQRIEIGLQIAANNIPLVFINTIDTSENVLGPVLMVSLNDKVLWDNQLTNSDAGEQDANQCIR